MVDGAPDLAGGVGGASRHFMEVLELPEKLMESRKQWEKRSVLVRSLGRRVPSDWVAKELKLWGNVQGELEAFALTEDHHLVRF